jgi:hypothetical protein
MVERKFSLFFLEGRRRREVKLKMKMNMMMIW